MAARGSVSFPPLRSGSNLPGNLPTQVTEFVGREAELRSVREAVESARVVTLTGVGGAGKTRLALQFAAEAQPGFRHGVWLCELAPLTSSDAVGPLVGGVMGVEPGDGGWVAAIAEALASRQLLLVLDNCEHVLDAAATLADALVRGCPEVVVVATSREGLGLEVSGSFRSDHSGFHGSATGQTSRAADAVSLFVSRARGCDRSQPMTTTRSRRSRTCVVGSTASRWRSSSPRPARDRYRSSRSLAIWTIASSS